MDCLVCSYSAPKDEFYRLRTSIEGWDHPVASNKTKHLGSVDVFACPNCGALHTDLRGAVMKPERKD